MARLPRQQTAGTIRNRVTQTREYRRDGQDPIGQALENAGSAIGEVANRVRDAQITNQVADAEIQTRKELSKVYDEIEQDGTLSPDQIQSEYERRAEEVLKAKTEGISSSPAARRLWTQRTRGLVDQGSLRAGALARKRLTEREAAGAIRAGEELAKLSADVSISPTDLAASTQVHIERINRLERTGILTADQAERQRIAAENTEQSGLALRDEVSIESLMDSGQIVEAATLLNRPEVKQRLGAAKHRQIEDRLQRAGKVFQDQANTAQEQSIIDDVWKRYGGNDKAARAWIRENHSGEREDNLIKRYDARHGEVETEELSRRRQIINQAVDLYEKGVPVAQWPIALRAELPESKLDLFKERELGGSGIPETTEGVGWAHYARFRDMHATDPEAFKKIEPMEFRETLGNTEFKEMIRLQSELSDPSSQISKAKRPLGETVTQAVNNASELMKLNDKKKALLWRDLNPKLEEFQKDNGRQPTPTEVQDIVDELSKEIRITKPGRLWGQSNVAKGRRFEIQKIPGIEEQDVDFVLDAMVERYGEKFTLKQAQEFGRYHSAAMTLLRENGITEPTDAQYALAIQEVAGGG